VEYDAAARRIVAAWKEHGLRRLAVWAAQVAAETLAKPIVDCLVAVPPDPERRLRRGHHAATGFARELAVLWELPLESLLERTRPSTPQRGLDDAARRKNVAGAFCSRPSPRKVLVVDDVYTTGATVNAAASALRKADARHVEVVTFARTIRVR
jgi:predicted amidophosphoribosyltransferase